MKKEFQVEGMSCASCVRRIEKAVKQIEGVNEVQVNFATGKAIVDMDQSVTEHQVIHAIHDAGYDAEIKNDVHVHKHHADFYRFLICLLLTLPLMMLHPPLQAVLATIVQFWGAYHLYLGSYHSLRTGSANMDLLIIIGTTAAYLFSMAVLIFGLNEPIYFETSSMIVTLVLFGRWLESKSKAKASEAIEKLLQLQPKNAKVKRGDEFVLVPISEMKQGDLFMVRPGESVPVDGEVVEGESSVNEALLTGESLPVEKTAGSSIFAATNNQNGALIAKATKLGSDTALAAIIRLVDQAQSSKAPIQRLADQIAEVFVPVVIAISLLTFAGWWLLGGSVSAALISAVAVLVIACPCAIGLATPTVIVVASGKGASLGILFKEVAALERAKSLNTLILDKTGTITEGKPEVSKVQGDVLEIAYALENGSQHPLAEAIASYAKKMGTPLQKVEGFESLAGKGVRGKINGVLYTAGSMQFAKEEGVDLSQIQPSGVVVWQGNKYLGCLAIADKLKKNSREAIDRINAMGIDTMMLTGDNLKTAEFVAKEAHVKAFEAEVLPDEKAGKVNGLKREGKVVGMVGDGINDAPALASADVSFAIGAGSDIALESADIILMKNDLMSVVDAIELSKATFKKMNQNLFLALVYNCLAIPIAALGYLNPMIAAAAMALSSVSVVGNAILLKYWKPK